MLRAILIVVAVALCTLSSAVAQEVGVTWQARLLETNGAPVLGTHDVTITLRDGTAAVLWQKTFGTTDIEDGYVRLVLTGDDDNDPVRTLTSSLFLGDVFVGVALDGGTELGPQQALTSVPRAASVVGSVRLLDDTTPCDGGHGGALRWTGAAFEVCNSYTWVPLVSAQGDGSTQAGAAASCKAIHDAYPSLTDGMYYIDPNGGSTSDAFQAWCEMDFRDGGWTLCLSNVERGKGTLIADSNSWWTSNWDNGTRVLTRGNKDQGSAWGNFCPSMADSITEIYASVYAESNAVTTGDVCTANANWWTPGSGHMALACQGTTLMSALPKSGYENNGCVGCIYRDNETTPNASGYSGGHNFYGTHMIARLGGANAYGPGGIHWGYVNPGMTDPTNGGDVHCGELGTWCYEAYWARSGGSVPNVWKKSMQLWVR